MAKAVLSWIFHAKRELSPAEIQHAVAVRPGKPELDNNFIPTLETIGSVCAGLITIDTQSDVIRLVHYTTQEYFKETKHRWFSNAETDITTTCVTYLSFSIFQSGYCQTDEEFEERLRANPLYDYAAHNWGHHARNAVTSSQGIRFLESKAKIEASSQALMAEKRWSGHSNYSQEFPKQMTGLHLAAYFGLDNAVRNLLGGSDPDLKDSYNRTPLSWAARNGHEAVVRQLLDRGAVVDAKDRTRGTPLLSAAENGHEAVVRQLLDRGADVDANDYGGRTPLSWAAENGHDAVMRLLQAHINNIHAASALPYHQNSTTELSRG